MLFRPVVQRHAKRNAQDATLATAFVVLARQVRLPRQGRHALAGGMLQPVFVCLPEKYLSWSKEKYFSCEEFKLE
ncbi:MULTISPECIES: hypothetical protein [unclassified Janthinobacterium]|uniref:hypothetical protein n=1 Tax=unclassified Janthinobacterium TaxID=2610881 RepID=UPI0011136C66|nr:MULTISPECIES: hypothetical protein [unclassified Janthinobacterium]